MSLAWTELLPYNHVMRNEPIVFREPFNDLRSWHQEGAAGAHVSSDGALVLQCIGSKQGGVGSQVFCRRRFPDNIAVEFSLLVRESDGLIITFVALEGTHGEDPITAFRPRAGAFADYVGEDAQLRSYHVSVSRYNDRGEHTGVSNWRRNPGLHLMAQGNDLCREIGRTYEIRIEKRGPSCLLRVDGKEGPGFTDPMDLPGEPPSSGLVGFRAIGTRVVAEIRSFRVKELGA